MTTKLKTTAIALAATLASATAFAAEGDFAKADQNADGALSYDEIIAVMPDMTADQFKSADADGNGTLSQTEFEAVTG